MCKLKHKCFLELTIDYYLLYGMVLLYEDIIWNYKMIV